MHSHTLMHACICTSADRHRHICITRPPPHRDPSHTHTHTLTHTHTHTHTHSHTHRLLVWLPVRQQVHALQHGHHPLARLQTLLQPLARLQSRAPRQSPAFRHTLPPPPLRRLPSPPSLMTSCWLRRHGSGHWPRHPKRAPGVLASCPCSRWSSVGAHPGQWEPGAPGLGGWEGPLGRGGQGVALGVVTQGALPSACQTHTGLPCRAGSWTALATSVCPHWLQVCVPTGCRCASPLAASVCPHRLQVCVPPTVRSSLQREPLTE